MKKGTYQSRRRVRKIKRFVWVFKLKAKNIIMGILTRIVGFVFGLTDRLFRKQLRVIRRGEIYEGIKK